MMPENNLPPYETNLPDLRDKIATAPFGTFVELPKGVTIEDLNTPYVTYQEKAREDLKPLVGATIEYAKAVAGIKHDSGKPPLGLLPPKALREVAEVMAFGAKKYGKHNYLAGMDWSRLYDAMLRHVNSFIDGEDNDPETGLSHIAHASCCALFLLEYIKRDIGTDDRYVQSN